jgi:hypothetical protein
MEDQNIKNFLCACDCKAAISKTITEHKIPIEEYKAIFTDIKNWLEFLIEV